MRTNPSVLTGLIFLIISLLFATGMASRNPPQPAKPQYVSESAHLLPITVDSAAALESRFDALDYSWPPSARIPALALQNLPHDFADIRSSSARKHLFLRTLLPIVIMENRHLREQRQLAQLLLDSTPTANGEREDWLKKIAREHRIRGDLRSAENRRELLKRLDEIPTAMTLAQAAIESGWGTSRFAREGNSLFGQWTYKKTGGLTPEDRAEDASHSVKAFANLQASVRAYMHNLNIGHAYEDLRDTRARLRGEGKTPGPIEIAAHLQRYSQRGEAYVREVQRMIASRDFAELHLEGNRGPQLMALGDAEKAKS